MNIQYYGDFCFKITTKPNGRATEDVVIVTDLPEKGAGLRGPQGEADIVLLSHQNGEEEGTGALKGAPVALSTPGEFAAKGVTILGFPSFRDEESGTKRGQNTIFLLETEEMLLCFLGALGAEPDPATMERLDRVDVLFVPAGGTDTMPLSKLDELVRKIEPKVVVPMHYKIEGMTTSLPELSAFCKAMGNCPKESLLKWNVKSKDLEGKSLEVVTFDRN